MDRQIVYPGAIPLETDILNTNKFAMIGIAKLAHAILGDGPFLNALSCTATTPASLQVTVNPGQIYQLTNMDATAYSSLAADTTHPILKQGVLFDAINLNCPAPVAAGQSINYLIQVGYMDADNGSTVLPYYNSSNPAQAYNGPNNAGTAQATIRQGVCSVLVKAGAAATTGTQSTPSPDAGYCGAYVVTVANGQSAIISANVATYVGAPFISDKLQAKITQAQADARYGQLAVSNVWNQPQSVPNATVNAHALNLGQANTLYAPTGIIVPYGAFSAPSGWLLCDGSAVSRTTYANLFNALSIQTTGNTTSASATIAGIPSTANMQVGMAISGSGIPIGATIATVVNATSITISANATATATNVAIVVIPYGAGDGATTFNIPNLLGRTIVGQGQGTGLTARILGSRGGEETHTLTIAEMPAHDHTGGSSSPIGAYATGGGNMGNYQNVGMTGGGQAHNNMPPYLILNFIIKY